MSKTIITGIKPTGQAHIGNYLGAIRPALKMSEQHQSFLFIADYHALTSVHEAKELSQQIYEITATWMACGLDSKKALIYRQSDIPEIFELSWVLSCFTAKGLMNRAHAYKAHRAENDEAGKKDLDEGVNMGLFNYPILMSADILMFNADEVPVGEDQVQHIEYARDIAQKFNRVYGEVIKVPKAVIQESQLIPGLDGRKMSKSYNNYIPLFDSPKHLHKLVMKIKTNSAPPEDPKDPKGSILFDLYKEFASSEQIEEMKKRYRVGVGWGEVKQSLYEAIDERLTPFREKYVQLINDKDTLDDILYQGAVRAREIARPIMDNIRHKIGIAK